METPLPLPPMVPLQGAKLDMLIKQAVKPKPKITPNLSLVSILPPELVSKPAKINKPPRISFSSPPKPVFQPARIDPPVRPSQVLSVAKPVKPTVSAPVTMKPAQPTRPTRPTRPTKRSECTPRGT